ncbi:DsrE/DsrF/TusD sulfur relay family protein [Alloalcanivorax gelatiniphagus]|uniref:Multidrug transporter n=1 Tax=Alloalcanivorax gelatiniphagus TaxID=1194167 RepID=A0ABY2XNF9_9GAMM|nr:DsrE family protein [Alloalcanivorax gelatiniphagus]TMW13967.1 multidrug transporter [Alloalcanivorax gelatiniphagus]|tara:strand:- start:7192 stop:7548 length:357 start_codon:yes stop_codon:yes gene_type:complete
MTEFSLLVTAGPQRPGALTALRTARALQASPYPIYRLFFYGEGVLLAHRLLDAGDPASETARAWQHWVRDTSAPATVCVGAAHKRGVTAETLAGGFQLVGLGDWVDALNHGGRVVHFG